MPRWDEKPSSKVTGRKYYATIERDGQEIDVIMTYNFYPGEPKTWDSPGWPGEVEIYEAKDTEGKPVELTDAEEDMFTEDIMRWLEEYMTTPPDYEDF